MAASLSRRLLLSRPLLSPFRNPNHNAILSPSAAHLCSVPLSGDESDSDPTPSPPESDPSASESPKTRPPIYRPLENGLDAGVYKAIMVGKVGQKPVQKQLRSGRNVVLFSLGTGGIRNNRRPLDSEEPREYADRCAVQWHRVSVYPQRLGELALKNVEPGAILYLEGNLETKIFSDPITGLVRRIREIAIRGDGRLVFLSNLNDAGPVDPAQLKSVGYY